jgi:hypothetical protein
MRHTREMHAHEVLVHEMHAREVHAYEIHAHKVQAYETHAREMRAHETHAYKVYPHKIYTCEIHVLRTSRVSVVIRRFVHHSWYGPAGERPSQAGTSWKGSAGQGPAIRTRQALDRKDFLCL